MTNHPRQRPHRTTEPLRPTNTRQDAGWDKTKHETAHSAWDRHQTGPDGEARNAWAERGSGTRGRAGPVARKTVTREGTCGRGARREGQASREGEGGTRDEAREREARPGRWRGGGGRAARGNSHARRGVSFGEAGAGAIRPTTREVRSAPGPTGPRAAGAPPGRCAPPCPRRSRTARWLRIFDDREHDPRRGAVTRADTALAAVRSHALRPAAAMGSARLSTARGPLVGPERHPGGGAGGSSRKTPSGGGPTDTGSTTAPEPLNIASDHRRTNRKPREGVVTRGAPSPPRGRPPSARGVRIRCWRCHRACPSASGWAWRRSAWRSSAFRAPRCVDS